ncbi:hypothetical protein, partial [Companilactobacillus alimentarius]
RHDFELLHSSQNLKTRSYSKQQVAKNNLAIEPSQGFCSRLDSFFYLDRFRRMFLNNSTIPQKNTLIGFN